MKHLTVAQAKAHLSAILDEVIAGENVIITRRGKSIARIAAETGEPSEPKPSFDFGKFCAHLVSMPMTEGDTVARMRRDYRALDIVFAGQPTSTPRASL